METMFDLYNEWKLARLGKFTASNIGKLLVSGKTKGEIFGDGAETLINQVISEILTGVPFGDDDYKEIKALEWGKAHELEAVEMLQQRLGVEVEYFGVLNPVFIPYNKVSGGSPDGKVASINYGVELKCPINKSKHVAALRATIEYGTEPANAWLKKHNKDYYAQVQFNMMCGKFDGFYFGSYDPRPLDPRNKIAVLTIAPDLTMHKDIHGRLELAKDIVRVTLNGLEDIKAIAA